MDIIKISIEKEDKKYEFYVSREELIHIMNHEYFRLDYKNARALTTGNLKKDIFNTLKIIE